MAKPESPAKETQGKFFTYFVDGREFHTEKESLTCGEIMDAAEIPREVVAPPLSASFPPADETTVRPRIWEESGITGRSTSWVSRAKNASAR